jgi:hypothetical protein
MKSTVTIEEIYQRLVEMDSAGVLGGSAEGFSPTNPTSSDFYAPGDARIATPDPYIRKRSGIIKRTKKRLKRKNKK